MDVTLSVLAHVSVQPEALESFFYFLTCQYGNQICLKVPLACSIPHSRVSSGS